MTRLIFIILVIMFAKFIKKVMESAAQNKSQSKPSSEFAESEKDLDDLLTGDDFLKDFKRDSAPALAREGNFLASITDVLETERKTDEQVLKIEPSFEEFQQKVKPLQEQVFYRKQPALQPDTSPSLEKSDDVLDLSAEKIQSAFVMKEILSPPVALRGHDADAFFLI